MGTNFGSFKLLPIDERIKTVLSYKSMELLTPVQRKAIPSILAGKDTIVCSRTGSGKTLSFLVPIIHKLSSNHSKPMSCVRCLIIVPNRELALQIYKVAKLFSRRMQLKMICLIGGKDFENDENSLLKFTFDLVIATPGRLLHLINSSLLNCKLVEFLVLDEADILFEIGFKDQILSLINFLPSQRQNIFLSATMPTKLEGFINDIINNPNIIRLDLDLKLSPNLKLVFISCLAEDHESLFLKTISDLYENGKNPLVAVFVATHFHAEYLCEILKKMNYNCTCIFGTMDQAARTKSLSSFVKKQNPTVIVTDVIARGIDIPSVDYIVNFHIPPDFKLFLHRVGRTARNGLSGTAITFFRPNEQNLVRSLNHEINSNKHQVIFQEYSSDSLLSFRSFAKKIIETDPFISSTRVTAFNAEKMYFKTCFKDIKIDKSALDNTKELVPKVNSDIFCIKPKQPIIRYKPKKR